MSLVACRSKSLIISSLSTFSFQPKGCDTVQFAKNSHGFYVVSMEVLCNPCYNICNLCNVLYMKISSCNLHCNIPNHQQGEKCHYSTLIPICNIPQSTNPPVNATNTTLKLSFIALIPNCSILDPP